jgi:LuxR family maltose regulon positive regulatory protein
VLAEALTAVDSPTSAARSLRGVAGIEELSAREVEVLRALGGTGSLREVADALYISRNTIKTHTRALYAKLGVGTREEAVRRGRQLGLLARSHAGHGTRTGAAS